MSQRLQVIRRDVIPWILPPRPAGPDRHPALAGEAGSATSPKKKVGAGSFPLFLLNQQLLALELYSYSCINLAKSQGRRQNITQRYYHKPSDPFLALAPFLESLAVSKQHRFNDEDDELNQADDMLDIKLSHFLAKC